MNEVLRKQKREMQCLSEAPEEGSGCGVRPSEFHFPHHSLSCVILALYTSEPRFIFVRWTILYPAWFGKSVSYSRHTEPGPRSHSCCHLTSLPDIINSALWGLWQAPTGTSKPSPPWLDTMKQVMWNTAVTPTPTSFLNWASLPLALGNW